MVNPSTNFNKNKKLSNRVLDHAAPTWKPYLTTWDRSHGFSSRAIGQLRVFNISNSIQFKIMDYFFLFTKEIPWNMLPSHILYNFIGSASCWYTLSLVRLRSFEQLRAFIYLEIDRKLRLFFPAKAFSSGNNEYQFEC